MEDFENIAARERGEWEENNVLAALDLMKEGEEKAESTTPDKYERIFAEWERWGDEMDIMGDYE